MPSKRGSPTVEYVFVMMAATMLAGIVVGIVKSEPVQASLRQVILCSVPFLYDENGEPSCKAGKYMAKEDPKPEKPDPPEDEFSPIPLHTKPEPTPPVKPVKSDPSWYECALSWDCIKKKGGELLSGPSEEKKKQLREERIKRLLEEARKHCGNDSECIANYVGKRIAYDQMGTLPQLQGLIGFSKLIGSITGVDPFFEWVSFGVDHPEFTIGLAATIIALFVAPPLGVTMLVSGAISGGVSWLQGNDPDTILRDMGIGGFAGVFGYGVFAGVSRYAGAKLAQSTLNPFLQKWLPKIIGGGSGGVADQSTFDGLRDRKLDWRSATLAGMIGLLIPYAGAIIDGAPALSKSFQQMIPGVSGDGTLAMPWVKKNGQEAADQYQYISPEDWEKMTPEQKAKVNEGNAFNDKMSPKYSHNEVYVKYKDKKGRWQNGKVDSYDPIKGEIISRKHTQLAEIQYQTARDYMNEFLMKYSPGTEIRDVPTQRPGSGHQNADLAGDTLEGRMFLEVPVQKKPVPNNVREYATDNDIIIRDEKGKVYNPEVLE
ncbi:DUF4244 domain-containing protein [Kroppenstedtia sanguinis]|uniref:DUF4244 domain-containing protein n=1 Tax=Kroppenstedtia sanguinis TaxID=1380684 RepID=A0ABW4C6Q2_9BACL